MDSVVCKECGKGFETLHLLHKHFRLHGMLMEAYYHKWEPRFDLYSGEPIKFDNIEQYRYTDFVTRGNCAAWFRETAPEKVREYIKEWLIKRKERKNILWSPCQVELRTSMMAGMKYISNLFGCSYYDFAKSLGFQQRFSLLGWSADAEPFEAAHRVLVDSREQRPLSFSLPSETSGLLFADYALNDMEVSRHCFIERKSINDLYITLGTQAHIKRFQNELKRAKSAGAYIVVLVEGSLDDVTNSEAKGQRRVPYHVIFYHTRLLIQANDHIQFLFVKDRGDASQAIERIFSSRGEFKKLDLQYAYDTGTLL